MFLYVQWWLWEDGDVHHHQHPAGAAEDRRSGGCLPHCSGAAAAASQDGPECGELTHTLLYHSRQYGAQNRSHWMIMRRITYYTMICHGSHGNQGE